MQVACGCDEPNGPVGMDQFQAWDGEITEGFVAGRRYVWQCPACHHTVCVNMTLIEEKPQD